jgi:hypothetical protein
VYDFWQEVTERRKIALIISATLSETFIILSRIQSGFGGLEEVFWPLVPKFACSYPAEAVGFLGRKKFSARFPSDGK